MPAALLRICRFAPQRRTSVVLTFQEFRDWDKIEIAMGKRNGTNWVPLEAKIGRGKPKHFVYMGGLLVADDGAK